VAGRRSREADREQLEEDRPQECMAQVGLENRSEEPAEVPAEAGHASGSHQSHAEGAQAAQDILCSLAAETEADGRREEGDSHTHRSERREEGNESPDHPCSREEGEGNLCCQCDQSAGVRRGGYYSIMSCPAAGRKQRETYCPWPPPPPPPPLPELGHSLVVVCYPSRSSSIWRHLPRPVPKLTTLEASSGITRVLGRLTSAVGDLDANFVAHEEALVVLRDALLGSLLGVEFLKENENIVLGSNSVCSRRSRSQF
jgi:hypothetical protein